MRVTFYALKRLDIGSAIREPGDLLPEAAGWTYLSGYINDGQIAPVLVSTLPEADQAFLSEWEAAQAAPIPVPVPDPVTTTRRSTKEKTT